MKKKKGFTLAELLITLTMVGIIATLVIPPIAQRIQEVQLKIAFKENYSIIDKAFQRAIQNNGGTFAGIATNESDVDIYVIADTLAPYLNYVKKTTTPGECWPPDNVVKDRNGDYWNWGTGQYCLMLANGATFFTWGMKGSCKYDEGGGFYTCGNLYIDVNGLKGPNMWGKDIFQIYIRADRIAPYGISGSPWWGACPVGGDCAVNILLD